MWSQTRDYAWTSLYRAGSGLEEPESGDRARYDGVEPRPCYRKTHYRTHLGIPTFNVPGSFSAGTQILTELQIRTNPVFTKCRSCVLQ